MDIEKITNENLSNNLDQIKALQPLGWSDISQQFSQYVGFDFCHPICVKIEGNIAGVGCSILFQNSAWIAHIIVGSDYRRQGVGALIVESLIEEIRLRKIETILLIATPMGEPVYTKVGFRAVTDYLFFERVDDFYLDKTMDENKTFALDSIWREENWSKNIKKYDSKYYNQIMKLDEFVTGENRGILIEQFLSKSFLYCQDEKVEGFYLPGLGAGGIFAFDDSVGFELMKVKYSTVTKAVIPAENVEGIVLLEKNGFAKIPKIARRMILGPDVNWKPNCIFSRISGNYG